MNSDFRDLLHALHEAEVRYLVVGGYAVIHHAQPRFTKDLDIWIVAKQVAGRMQDLADIEELRRARNRG